MYHGVRTVADAVKKIERNARKAGPKLQSIAESVASRFGARVTPLNYKGAASIARKLDGNPNKVIKDAARTTIIASKDEIPKIIAALKKSPGVSNYKEHNAKDNAGYTGHLFNFKIKGVMTEIQVNTPEMIYAKESMRDALKILGKAEYLRIRRKTGQFAGWGHKYYEDSRSKRADNPKRRKGNSSEIDSKNYYSSFS